MYYDLTWKNIVLSRRGAVILDFGISVASDSVKITRDGQVLGTLAFMSPEALRGDQVGHPADVYSLGVVAAFATTGRLPFDGDDIRQLRASMAAGPELGEAPRQLRPILRRMLASDPAARPTLTQLRDDLTSLQVARPTATTTRPIPRTTTTTGTTGGWTKLFAGVSVAGFLVVAVGLGWFINSADRPEEVSRRVAAQATDLLHSDPGQARRLALAAYAASPTHEAQAGLVTVFGAAPPQSYRGPATSSNAAAFSPDGQLLAVGAGDNQVRIWDTAQGPSADPIIVPHDDQVLDVTVSHQGTILAVAGADGTVALWDISDPTRPARRGILPGHGDFASSVSFSPDGREPATAGSDGWLRIWDVANPSRPVEQATVVAGETTVSDAVYSPDGRTIATAGRDQSIRLWDVSGTGTPVEVGVAHPPSTAGEPPVTRRVAFSPDGGFLAVAVRGDSAYLYDLKGTEPLVALPPLVGHHEWVNDVAFTADGQFLATGDDAGTVLLWDTADPRKPVLLTKLIDDVESDRSWINGLAFSPDG